MPDNKRRLAVIFPGIGYHCDKPLLYYSKKLLNERGYKTVDVAYGNFPDGVKGSAEKMKQSFEVALAQAEEILKDIRFDDYDEVVFVMKSVGTAVGGAYSKKHGIEPEMIILTPVEATFQFLNKSSGIVFHGTADTWVDTEVVKNESERLNLPLHIIKNANHSLETGNVDADIFYIHEVMKIIDEYVKG